MKPSAASEPAAEANRRALRFAMTLSLVIGCLLLLIKWGAYLLTGSSAILSDAAESVVHVAAVAFAFYSLRLSHRPADASHLYGHTKIAFFSAGFEGAMIILAALYIIYQSIQKWIVGLHLENLGLGTLLTILAAVVNGGLGAYLLWMGKRRQSLILCANGRHVLTDVWTSLAAVVGLLLVQITGWLPWDPICGLAMAVNILVSGAGLVRSASAGLMDSADPEVGRRLTALLDRITAERNVTYHQLRHRNIGDAHWIELHLLFPEGISLAEAHRQATEIERAIETEITPCASVTTHLECRADHDQVHPDETLDAPGG
ncbi:MAG TPA: cation diffusion facilitator family transporter [Verrucomicrobiota bacterium]|nr:cation diffusion facilitator family transporter [Verrucomicrobiota bacterium]HNU49319.1 cation diffusion facilitator family transporter [Verrucomicrobiota bacterium]